MVLEKMYHTTRNTLLPSLVRREEHDCGKSLRPKTSSTKPLLNTQRPSACSNHRMSSHSLITATCRISYRLPTHPSRLTRGRLLDPQSQHQHSRFIPIRPRVRSITTSSTHSRVNLSKRRFEELRLPVGGNGFVTLQVSRGVQDATSDSASSQESRENSILVLLPGGLSPIEGPVVCEAASNHARSPSTKNSTPTSLAKSRTYNSTSTAPSSEPHSSRHEDRDIDGHLTLEEIAARISPATTIINLEYRIGVRSRTAELDHRFPTPIHDVFTAFEYVIDPRSPHNVRGTDTRHSRETVSQEDVVENSSESLTRDSHGSMAGSIEIGDRRPRICLYSSYVGAALALSLTLTNPHHIHAVAILNPLVDWVVLDELIEHSKDLQNKSTAIQSSKSKQKQIQEQASAAKELIKLRTALFRTPSGYFDSFASPVLFLRAPGQDTPTGKTASSVKVDEVQKELNLGPGLSERLHGFGPYDDDFHAHDGVLEGTFERSSGRLNDSVGLSNHPEATLDVRSPTRSPKQTPTDLSYWTPRAIRPRPTSLVRRRKVLRRWPPTSPSNSSTSDSPIPLLPYTNIFVSPAPLTLSLNKKSAAVDAAVDLHPALAAQAHELKDLLQRACFWGTEAAASLAQERVNLTQPSQLSSSSAAAAAAARGSQSESGNKTDSVKEEILDWMCGKLAEKK